jgi:alpha-tubulin suppressor-like RCC1 family protein
MDDCIFQAPKLLAVASGESSYSSTTLPTTSLLHRPMNSTIATHSEIQSLRTASFINSYGYQGMIKGESLTGEQKYYVFGSNTWNELSFVGKIPPPLPQQQQKQDFERVTQATFEEEKFTKRSIERIALGYLFSAILLDDNRLFVYGTVNEKLKGTLLEHEYLNKYKVREMRTSFYELYILFENNECICTDRDMRFQSRIYKDIHRVVPGGYYCTFIKTDGTLCGIGSGNNGEFANTQHTAIVDPVPFCFQSDSVRDAVLPATQKVKFISTSWYTTLVVTHSNRIFGCGSGIGHNLVELECPELTQKGIAKVLGYYDEFIFLTNDKQVYLRGNRGYGLGAQPSSTQIEYKQISFQHLEDKIRGLEVIDIGVAYNSNFVLFGLVSTNEQIQFWKRLHFRHPSYNKTLNKFVKDNKIFN